MPFSLSPAIPIACYSLLGFTLLSFVWGCSGSSSIYDEATPLSPPSVTPPTPVTSAPAEEDTLPDNAQSVAPIDPTLDGDPLTDIENDPLNPPVSSASLNKPTHSNKAPMPKQ
ncbi:MAG: hypothetical protein U0003_04270 [Vampirovibrionales bacterium]